MLDIFRIDGYEPYFVAAAGMNDAMQFFSEEYDLDDEYQVDISIHRFSTEEIVKLFIDLDHEEAEELLKAISVDDAKAFFLNADDIDIATKSEANRPDVTPWKILQTTEDSDNAERENIKMQESAIEGAEAISFEEFLKIKKGFTYEDYQIFVFRCKNYGIGDALAYMVSAEHDDNVPF